jgi:hypothetical protein
VIVMPLGQFRRWRRCQRPPRRPPGRAQGSG